VGGDLVEHVVVEGDAGVDPPRRGTVEVHCHGDLVSLVSRTTSARRAAGLSAATPKAASAASFSASVPIVRRRPPGAALGRKRARMPSSG
jgi:hypothetical protein